jgi:thioredoxin 1
MKKNKMAMVFVAMMLALMFTSVVSANVNGLSNDSLNSETDSILSSGKNVFMFFHTDWCHFCQQQKPIIDELEQEYAENITFFHVDCEEHPEAVREFGVNGYPAMFLITGKREDGQFESQYFGGFTDKETLKTCMDWIIANGSITENSMPLPLRIIGVAPTLLNDGDMYIISLASAASEDSIIPIESTCPFSPPGVTSRRHWFWIPGDPQCRGACGPDCPSTCRDLDNISICVSDGERDFVCKYTIIKCGSHQGCVEHDNCFDDCKINNPSLKCYHRCNMNCTKNYDIMSCALWALGRDTLDTPLGRVGTPFDSYIKFSSTPIQTWCVGSTPYCVDGECVECRTNADCNEYDRVYCDNNVLMSDDYYCDNGSCSYETKIVTDCGAGGGYCLDIITKCFCWYPPHIPDIDVHIPDTHIPDIHVHIPDTHIPDIHVHIPDTHIPDIHVHIPDTHIPDIHL